MRVVFFFLLGFIILLTLKTEQKQGSLPRGNSVFFFAHHDLTVYQVVSSF